MVDGFTTDYTRLASAELEAAGISSKEADRNHHLNRAAVFAYLGDSEAQGVGKLVDMTAIGKVLVAAMALADAAGAPIVSIHIDSALVALGHYSTRMVV